MDAVPADIFRHIFTLIPRAFKYRSVCKTWRSKLSERMFVYLWEQQWIKSGVHLQWLEFDEPILRKGWFGNINHMGMERFKIPYNGYHFEWGGCNYYIFGTRKHSFRVNEWYVKIGKTYFYMDWQKCELVENKPYLSEDGFHVVKKRSWLRITNKKSKLTQCSKEQHANFLRIYNSGVFQHLIQAYLHFKSRA